MNKKLKMFNILRYLVGFVYIILMGLIGLKLGEYVAINSLDLNYIIIWFAIEYLIILFVCVLIHEFGHLIFGLTAKMKFISFNVLGLSLEKENDKFKLKYKRIKDAYGYCQMIFFDDIEYKKNDVISYYLGGCIFNLITAVIVGILYFIIEKELLKITLLLCLIVSLVKVINNMIPWVLKNGINSDMLNVIYYLKNPHHLDVVRRLTKIELLLKEGKQVIDIDKELFIKPKKITNYGDVCLAMYYIDYLVTYDRYEEAIKYIEEILDSNNDVLVEANINVLKTQLLLALFEAGYDLKEYENYWDKKYVSYLSMMGKMMPDYLVVYYIYVSLLLDDKFTKELVLKDLTRMILSIKDENKVKELKEIIDKVHNRE